jgi:hypothetical protein
MQMFAQLQRCDRAGNEGEVVQEPSRAARFTCIAGGQISGFAAAAGASGAACNRSECIRWRSFFGGGCLYASTARPSKCRACVQGHTRKSQACV